MAIPGVCPSCGAVFDLPHAMTDAEARAALAAALDVPETLARLVAPYIALHAPGSRRMAWPKLARLLRELADQIKSGEVTRNRDTRPAPLALWREGIETILAERDAGTLDLPLKGHGLLAEIVHRRAGKAARAAEARDRPLHPSHAAAPSPAGVAAETPSPPRAAKAIPVAEHLANLRAAAKRRPAKDSRRDLIIAPDGEVLQDSAEQPKEKP